MKVVVLDLLLLQTERRWSLNSLENIKGLEQVDVSSKYYSWRICCWYFEGKFAWESEPRSSPWGDPTFLMWDCSSTCEQPRALRLRLLSQSVARAYMAPAPATPVSKCGRSVRVIVSLCVGIQHVLLRAYGSRLFLRPAQAGRR